MALTDTTEIAPTQVATARSSGPSSADLNNKKSFQAGAGVGCLINSGPGCAFGFGLPGSCDAVSRQVSARIPPVKVMRNRAIVESN